MAHELSFDRGRAELAYAGPTPWHGLGTPLPSAVTAAEAIRHAHLEWQVISEPLFLRDGTRVSDAVALVREDHRTILAVVSSRYRPIQNSQAAELVDAVVAEGRAVIEVAGALREGRQCWMLAKLPADEFEVVPGDGVVPYILAAWGHDGKHGVVLKTTPIRVVCANTLAAAGLGAGSWSGAAPVYLRHCGQVSVRIEEARRALGLVRRQVESTAAAYRALASHQLTESAARDYFRKIFPEPARQDDEDGDAFLDRYTRWQEHQGLLLKLFERGTGNQLAGVRGTAWAAYNAVTEWADHFYPRVKSGAVSTHRLQSSLLGPVAELKQQALATALEVAA